VLWWLGAMVCLIRNAKLLGIAPTLPPPTTSNVEILGNFYFYYLLVKAKEKIKQ
jgi:hypothetical protein